MGTGKRTWVDNVERPRTPWMGAVPKFTADRPPRDWERQHDHALQVTALNANRLHRIHTIDPKQATRLHDNRPAPRQAGAHYYNSMSHDSGAVLLY